MSEQNLDQAAAVALLNEILKPNSRAWSDIHYAPMVLATAVFPL